MLNKLYCAKACSAEGDGGVGGPAGIRIVGTTAAAAIPTIISSCN